MDEIGIQCGVQVLVDEPQYLLGVPALDFADGAQVPVAWRQQLAAGIPRYRAAGPADAGQRFFQGPDQSLRLLPGVRRSQVLVDVHEHLSSAPAFDFGHGEQLPVAWRRETAVRAGRLVPGGPYRPVHPFRVLFRLRVPPGARGGGRHERLAEYACQHVLVGHRQGNRSLVR